MEKKLSWGSKSVLRALLGNAEVQYGSTEVISSGSVQAFDLKIVDTSCELKAHMPHDIPAFVLQGNVRRNASVR